MPARVKFGKANTTPTKKRARPAVKVQNLMLDVCGFCFKVCTKFFRDYQLGAVWQSVPRDNRQFWC